MRAFSMVVAGALCMGLRATVSAEPAITVYNQDFAVVRDNVPLDLKAGVNQVKFTEVTNLLEPDSIILRDPAGKRQLAILEQNYRNDPVSQGLLLSLCEGKTIEFLVKGLDGKEDKVVQGKVIRSGYVPQAWPMYRYYPQPQPEGLRQPVIEVDGKMRFELPGTPLFPELTDATILKPTLYWQIETNEPGQFGAELAYVTGGMSWEADYNIVAPEEGEKMDLVGWVTVKNQTGKTFENARIKLMAGDVNKVQKDDAGLYMARASGGRLDSLTAPPVTEKTFEEYHLYTLQRPTTLHDRETKQVEFVRATDVNSKRLYVYDGAQLDQYRGWSSENIRNHPDYGTKCNKKVWVMREFKNSQENHLGMPLPKGRMRFYRQDSDRQLEFIGENTIDHTPKDETVRAYVGNAFDIVGERKRTNYKADASRNSMSESFEITLRNHKKQEVEVRIVEHLYRWSTWEVTEKSDPFDKKESQTIEFRVKVPADGEKTVTYSVFYSW